MKILVIGLDCAAPELLFGDERLHHIRRLMEGGCWGQLESIIPPITVPAWMCMSTSQDAGSLGVYGFRNRADHSYDGLSMVSSRSIGELAMWDQVAREGKRAVIVGVPPSYPPRRINGVCVGCMLTPDPKSSQYTHPPAVAEQIAKVTEGRYATDVKEFRTERKDWLKQQIYEMSAQQFQVVRYLMKETEWDYFHFVELGLDRLQHGFWKFHDPKHIKHEPGNPYLDVIRDYYAYLDAQVGTVLEMIDDDTVVLVASDHGAQRLDGGFCINEWLIREGLLTLQGYPDQPTRMENLPVDWERTRVWGDGGYYARIFLNLKGREPQGTIAADDYERFRDDLRARIEAAAPPGTRVFVPQEIYRSTKGVPPDLIVHFGDLHWRSIGSVGYGQLTVQENDTGPDDCNHAQLGSFILASPNNPLQGEMTGQHLLNVAPTLLELAGYDVPGCMQGRSMVSGMTLQSASPYTADEEHTVGERLRGLGYL